MNKYENEVLQVRTSIAQMGVAVDEMYRNALTALNEQDLAIAADVIKRDSEVDKLDVEIDDMCLKMLALYSPKASELRWLVAVLRIIIDLERVGDHCKVIAKQVKKHHFTPLIAAVPAFCEMAALTGRLLNDSLAAFFEKRSEYLFEIVETDKKIGSLQSIINKEMVALINRSPDMAKTAVALINVTRRLERIADHAKNIAETIPYINTGEIMRHKDIYADNME